MSKFEVAYRRTTNSSIQKTIVVADTREDAKAIIKRKNSSCKDLEIYDVKEK